MGGLGLTLTLRVQSTQKQRIYGFCIRNRNYGLEKPQHGPKYSAMSPTTPGSSSCAAMRDVIFVETDTTFRWSLESNHDTGLDLNVDAVGPLTSLAKPSFIDFSQYLDAVTYLILPRCMDVRRRDLFQEHLQAVHPERWTLKILRRHHFNDGDRPRLLYPREPPPV